MDKLKQPKVAIIILTYNPSKEHIQFPEVLLKSFEKLNYPNYKIYVVDNGSPKKNINILIKKFPKINFILHQKNWGFSIGNNLAMKKIIKEKYNPDYFLLLNDDMIINDGNFLKKMVDVGREIR